MIPAPSVLQARDDRAHLHLTDDSPADAVNLDIAEVTRPLGHSTPATASRYLHRVGDDLADAASQAFPEVS